MGWRDRMKGERKGRKEGEGWYPEGRKWKERMNGRKRKEKKGRKGKERDQNRKGAPSP